MLRRVQPRFFRGVTMVIMGIAVLALARIPATKGVGARPAVRQASPPAGSFTTFESGQVRPLALSPSGNFLFATNTPDNRLEIFHVTKAGLQSVGSVVVGLEPIAVAARSDTEVWVV